MAKSEYLETLEKLQAALSSFDMSFGVSNKLFRFAIVSEILDIVCLFDQLYTSWQEHLPFGEGPDADVDFSYWKQLNSWEPLLSAAKQNVCLDDYPFDMGNGISSDKIHESRRKSYLKSVKNVLRHSKYVGAEAVLTFVKTVNNDKTHMMTFGNMVFEALTHLILTLGKIADHLENPGKDLFVDFFETQRKRFNRECLEFKKNIREVMCGDLTERRKCNKLNTLKDEMLKALFESKFLDSLKDGINKYDIDDYRKDHPETHKTDKEIREFLALEELVDKEYKPNKEKIGRYIFKQRKCLSFEDIRCFFVCLDTTPMLVLYVEKLKGNNVNAGIEQPDSETRSVKNIADNPIVEAIQVQTEVLKTIVEYSKNQTAALSQEDGTNNVRAHSTVKSLAEGKKKKMVEMRLKPRETMTFERKPEVTEEHLKLLFVKLAQEGWVSGNESDFKALFSGKRDEDCVTIWLGKYGKSTLVELFQQFVNSGLVILPEGFTLSSILEGHFKDEEGQWLTGLNKGDASNKKALPVIAECVRLLKLRPDKALG